MRNVPGNGAEFFFTLAQLMSRPEVLLLAAERASGVVRADFPDSRIFSESARYNSYSFG